MKESPILKAEAPSADLAALAAEMRGGLFKAHVSGYTRKDGAFVKDHQDARPAAPPQAAQPAVPQAPPDDDGGEDPPDDDRNPEMALGRLDSSHLAAVTRGEHDLNRGAKKELAARGLDSAGKWMGFKQAAQHHGIAPTPRSGDPNPIEEHIQTLHPDVLAASASGKFDLNALARKQAAARGIDRNGKWVGFDKAKDIHQDKNAPAPAPVPAPGPEAAITKSAGLPLLFMTQA